MEGEGVEDLPEWFDSDDVIFHECEAAFVVVAVAVLVVVESPCVLERRGTELAKERDSALDFGRAGLWGGVFGGGTEGGEGDSRRSG